MLNARGLWVGGVGQLSALGSRLSAVERAFNTVIPHERSECRDLVRQTSSQTERSRSRQALRARGMTGWVLAGLVYASPAFAQARPTLRDFMSAPFASELVAAPTGGKIAWMQNVLGARNIWVA